MNPESKIPDSLFRLMVEQNSIGILLTGREGDICYVNPRALEDSGYTLEEVLGKNPRMFASGETPREVYEAMWATILSGRVWHGELCNRRKNGEQSWELVRISPIRDAQGEITHFFAIKEANLRAGTARWIDSALATIDPLTGLPNRGMLAERITAAIRRAGEREDAPQLLGLMMLDLDRFRLANDVVGHVGGDEVLKRVAQRLRETLRQSDMIARTGGNEFCILLDADPAEEQLEELGRRVLAAVAAPVPVLGRELSLTGSLGIGRFPLDAAEADSLLQCAAEALASAKAAGGDELRFFEPVNNRTGSDLADLAADLREVVQREELRLHFQPKVNLRSGKIVGFEALARWQHPQRGLIAPSRFIAVAEETGLITNLSQWVIRAALDQLAAWQASGLPLLPIGINLSLRHFHGSGLPRFIGEELARRKLPPECLELEIGESTMMRDPTQAFVIADRIRALGVRLALDEFGTGLSSLAYLSRLTVDALKIDQSFVRDITTNPINASIVAAIVAMAHKLGKRCVAVGVETEGQAQQLLRYECDEIQGYYFSKPVPPEEAAEILAQGRNLNLQPEGDAPPTLLLVDDEPNILNSLKRLLRRDGYRILTAESGPQALEVLAQNTVQVIVSDHRMPGMTGVEFLSRARELYPASRRIILSGYSDIGTLTDAINRGAVWKFISKPWDDEALKAEIKHAFEQVSA